MRFESLRPCSYCRSIRKDANASPFLNPENSMKKLFSALALAGFFASSLHAQQQIQLKVGDVEVGKMEYDAQKTPNFQAGDVKGKDVPNPRDWLELEVEFEVKGAKDAVVKELLFRYYIGFKDQTGAARILTGDVKHINIVPGDKSYSAVYVAPSTLGEITGDFRAFQPSAVQAVGVEVYYNGVIVGGKSSLSGSKAKFWEGGTQPGVLSKAETPFALLWIDRYAEVERTAR